MVPCFRIGVSLALSLSIAFAAVVPGSPVLLGAPAQAQQKLNEAELAKLRANVEKSRSGKKETLALNLYYLGQALAEGRRFEEALPLLNEALELDKSLNLQEQLMADLKAIGTVQIFMKQYDLAEKTYLQAVELAQTAKSDKQVADCYNYLGKCCSYARNFPKAQEYYEKAVEAAQKAGAFVSEAQARISLTQLLKINGKVEEAIKEAEAAKAIFGKNTDEAAVGQIVMVLGDLQEFAGEYEKSIENYKLAVQIYKNSGDGHGEGRALSSLANVYLMFGRPAEAVPIYERAHNVYDQEGDDQNLLQIMIRQGDAYADMGNFSEAQRLHGDAIKMAELQKNDDAWALAVTEKAYDQYLEGSPEKALKTFTELKDKLEHGLDVEDENLLPETLVSIARCYRNMGQMNAAVETYKLAQERYAKRQNKIGEVACADGIASTYSEFARRKEYEQQYAVVKNMLAEVPAALKSERDYRKLAALIAFNHAQHQLITEQYDGTVKSFTEAVAELNALNDMTTAPRAMCGLGMARLRSAQQAKKEGKANLNEVAVVNDLKAAIENFKKAEELALKQSNLEVEWDSAIGLGTAYRELGEIKSAEESLRKAISLFEKEKNKNSRDDSKTYTLDLRGSCFQELVGLLVAENKLDEALEIAERGRARAFLDLLEGRRVRQEQKLVATGETHKTELVAMAPPNFAPGAGATSTFRSVEVVPKTKNMVIDSTVSDVSAKAPDVAEIKKLIAESGSYIVEYYLSDDKVFAFVVSPDGKVQAPPPVKIDKRAMNQMVIDAYQEVISPPKDLKDLQASNERRQASLQKLYALLIDPIKPFLPTEAEKVLTIVPHGSLYKVPFAALIDKDGKFFIEAHTLAIVPAVGVFRATHKLLEEAHGGAGTKESLLAFGNPTMPKVAGLGQLPYAEREVKKISELFGPSSLVKVGPDASRTNLKELAPKVSVIHLATHGLLDEENPMDSSVILASSPTDDGLLTVRDILQLPALKARLITLSACQTGRGKITGDGVAGLSRAFILAGTPSVLVSLWNVDDVMTEYQMGAFYQNYLAGADKAKALRQAQLKTIDFMEKGLPAGTTSKGQKIRANPRYWAAFQLIGEYK